MRRHLRRLAAGLSRARHRHGQGDRGGPGAACRTPAWTWSTRRSGSRWPTSCATPTGVLADARRAAGGAGHPGRRDRAVPARGRPRPGRRRPADRPGPPGPLEAECARDGLAAARRRLRAAGADPGRDRRPGQPPARRPGPGDRRAARGRPAARRRAATTARWPGSACDVEPRRAPRVGSPRAPERSSTPGSIEEAVALRERFDPTLPCFSAIGYREAWSVADGERDLERPSTSTPRATWPSPSASAPGSAPSRTSPGWTSRRDDPTCAGDRLAVLRRGSIADARYPARAHDHATSSTSRPPVEKAFLVAVDTGAEDGWSAAGVPGRARQPGGHGRGRRRRRRVAEPPPRRPELVHRQGQGGGAGRGQARDRVRRAHRRRRAVARPAAHARGAARRQGHRPQPADPRHLRAARPDPRGPAPGRARAARVPAAAPDPAVDPPVADPGRHRLARSRRAPARDRPPDHPDAHLEDEGAGRAGPPAARDRRARS